MQEVPKIHLSLLINYFSKVFIKPSGQGAQLGSPVELTHWLPRPHWASSDFMEPARKRQRKVTGYKTMIWYRKPFAVDLENKPRHFLFRVSGV